MTGPPPIKVDIVAGQNTAIPALQRTGEEIAKVARGAGAGLSPLQRLGQATARHEAREPGLVLRQLRSGVEELAASAVGASGPVGRLGASLALLLPGGGLTLVGVGAFAAVGLGIKQVIDFSDQLDGTLAKLNQRFTDMVPAAKRLSEVAQLGTALSLEATPEEETAAGLPGQPGAMARLFSRVQGLAETAFSTTRQGTTGDVEEAFITETSAAIQTLNLERAQEVAQMHKEHDALIYRKTIADTKPEVEATVALAKFRLGLNPTATQLAALDSVSRATAIAMSNLDRPQKDRLLHLEAERAALETSNARLKDRDEILRKAGLPGAIPMSANERAAFVLSEHADFMRQRGNNFFVPDEATRESALMSAGLLFGYQGKSGEELPEGLRGHMHDVRPPGTATTPPAQDKELARDIGASVAAALALAGGIRRGDAASVLSGAAGAVSSLAQIKALAPTLGPAGAVLEGVAGVVSLFRSGQAKMTITRIEDEALAKLKDVLQLPQNVSTVFAGGPANVDTRQVRQDLDRLAAKTGVVTLPGRP